jgi:putative flippase GtrA
MTLAPSRIVTSAQRLYRTTLGKRFSRFVLVAAAAVAASQITLTLLLGVVGMSSGISGVVAAVAGALVSYVLSRWAWERKGKPHLLKETLPFWAVSVGAWIVLGLASHFSSVWAKSMGLPHWEQVAFVDGAYLVANCVTFATRFLIFHYVLFADRGSRVPPSAAAALDSSRVGDSAARVAGNGSEPFAATGPAARVNGSAVPASRAGRWAAPEEDGAGVPEARPRR